MGNTTSNISFYCRESKANKKGLAPIELCIIINGQRTTLALPRKEYPDRYSQLVKSRKSNDLKDYLEAVRQRLDKIMTQMMEKGIYLDAATLKEYFVGGGVKRQTIQTLFDEYIGIVRKRAATNDVTVKTLRKYELAEEKFFSLIDKDKHVSAITSSVIAEFSAVLKREYNQTTTNGYLQKVKTIVKYGMSKGYITVNPFIGTHIRKGDMDIQFLTEAELDRIRDTDFKTESINRVRDLFVFQAASGMSYCDMAALVPSDIQHTDEGQPFVHKRRAKTNIYFTSVILPDGIAILDKYDYILPIISNTKYNASLKFIKDICQIDKPLHTHIARHSYATRCINSGIRLEVVAKLLGHATTRITQHYARLLQKNIISEVQDAFDIQPQEISRRLRLGELKEQGIKK